MDRKDSFHVTKVAENLCQIFGRKDFEFFPGESSGVSTADGQNQSFDAVLFESEDEAFRFKEEKEGEYIGARFVNINELSYAEFQSFMDDQLGCISVNLERILNEDNLPKGVKLRGMPRDITKA